MNNLTIYATLTTTFLLASLVASNVCDAPYNQYVGCGGTVLFAVFIALLVREICERNKEYRKYQNDWYSYVKSRDKNTNNLLNEIIKMSLKQHVILNSMIEKTDKQSESNHKDIEILYKEISRFNEENNNNFKKIDDNFKQSIEISEISKKDIIQVLEAGNKGTVTAINNGLETFSRGYEEKNQELLNTFIDKNQDAVTDIINRMVEKNREVCDILKIAVGESAEAILNNTMRSIEAYNNTLDKFFAKMDEKISENTSLIKNVNQCVVNMENIIKDGIEIQTNYTKNMSDEVKKHINSQEKMLEQLFNNLSEKMEENVKNLSDEIKQILGDDGSFEKLMKDSLDNIKDSIEDIKDSIEDLKTDERVFLKSIRKSVEEMPEKLVENSKSILESMQAVIDEQNNLVKSMKKWNEDREKLDKQDYDLLWSVIKNDK